jgi:glycosyltransferase involved in cell wall biosynthesis
LLARLLQSVAELRTDGLATWTVVVDNDAAGSAEAAVRPFLGRIPNLVYEVEPERGVSAARNCLVAIAGRLGAEFVAFVDDDEWAEPAWLVNLVRTARRCNAVAVGGPVLPEYDDEVPRWIRKGRFFDCPRYPNGQEVRLSSTADLLVRRARLARLDGPFDRRFDLTGGEDSHMLNRLLRRRARMVWADKAVVHERVPASRGNVRWILERRFSTGVTSGQRASLRHAGFRQRARQVVGAISRLSSALPQVLQALIRGGREETLWALCWCSSQAGRLLG